MPALLERKSPIITTDRIMAVKLGLPVLVTGILIGLGLSSSDSDVLKAQGYNRDLQVLLDDNVRFGDVHNLQVHLGSEEVTFDANDESGSLESCISDYVVVHEVAKLTGDIICTRSVTLAKAS